MSDEDDPVLTLEQSRHKIHAACGANFISDEACCAIAGYRAAGWQVEVVESIDKVVIVLTRPRQ